MNLGYQTNELIRRTVERVTGKSIEELCRTPLCELREQVEEALGKPLDVQGVRIREIDTGYGIVRII